MRRARAPAVLVGLAVLAGANRVTISNLVPRLSIDGRIVNAHDGTIRLIDGVWWMHAAQYGECTDPPHRGCEMSGPTQNTSCGFKADHNVSIWRSPDLSSGSWQFVGHAVRCRDLPDCAILYRPHLVYNPASRLYVLYWNYVDKAGGYAGDQAAVSHSPAGPFTLATTGPINTTYASGDFDVFVDVDGAGYMIYTANFHRIYIELLTPDMLASTGIGANIPGGLPPPPPPRSSAPLRRLEHRTPLLAFPVEFVEAPVLFERRGTYYALFGHCCCFCYQGSGMYVFTAPHPLGPWTQQTEPDGTADYGCMPNATTPTPAEQHTLPATAFPQPGQGCLYGLPPGGTAASATRAQQNFVFETPRGEFVWTGDRWMQAADGIKGHEPQFWARLEFDAAGRVRPMRWVDEVTIEL